MKAIRVLLGAIGGFCKWLIKAVFRFMRAVSRVAGPSAPRSNRAKNTMVITISVIEVITMTRSIPQWLSPVVEALDLTCLVSQ